MTKKLNASETDFRSNMERQQFVAMIATAMVLIGLIQALYGLWREEWFYALLGLSFSVLGVLYFRYERDGNE